jgi:hypothetical protein
MLCPVKDAARGLITTQITRKQSFNIKNQVSWFKPLASLHDFEMPFSNFARNSGCPVVLRSFIRENIRSETNLEMIRFLHFPPKPLYADHFFIPQLGLLPFFPARIFRIPPGAWMSVSCERCVL